MVDENKEAKTIIDKIKKLLFNYDLSVAYAEGQIKLRQADMELYENKKSKASQKKYIKAKIEVDRFNLYILEINNAKNELTENLSIIISKYNDKYKEIFYSFFIEGKSYQEIADNTNYSLEAIKVIIRKLKGDLLELYTL